MIYSLLVYASLNDSGDENIQIEQYHQAEMVSCVVDDSCTQITQYIYYIYIYIYALTVKNVIVNTIQVENKSVRMGVTLDPSVKGVIYLLQK